MGLVLGNLVVYCFIKIVNFIQSQILAGADLILHMGTDGNGCVLQEDSVLYPSIFA